MGFGNFAKGQISNAFMPTYGFVYGGKYRNAWVALPWKHFSPQKDLAAVVNDPTTDPHSADTIEFWAQFKPGSDGKGFGGAGGPKEFLKAYSAKDIAAYEVLASSTYGDTAKTLSSTVVILYYKEGGSSTIDVQNYYYSAQNQRNAFRQANSALAMFLGFLNGVPRVGATAAQSGPAIEALAASPAPEAEEAVAQERIEEAPAEVLPQDTNDNSMAASADSYSPSMNGDRGTVPGYITLNIVCKCITIFAAFLGAGAAVTNC